ncbi:hypothetical protein [uncultured Jatrophihabitans sp.]|uniref:hypothetical protein n=1 Tax=uncultured Jatrophihabitans sp. TaxID=1610747 RepID=UPI0035CB21FE
MTLHAALPAGEDINRSPSFTLGTALVWLGHTCSGQCPPAVLDSRADVWFQRLPDRATGLWTTTLVDVEFETRSLLDGQRRDITRRINHCVRADHIRVRERTAVERATFVAALVARRNSAGRRQLALTTTNLPALATVSY